MRNLRLCYRQTLVHPPGSLDIKYAVDKYEGIRNTEADRVARTILIFSDPELICDTTKPPNTHDKNNSVCGKNGTF